MIGLIQPYVYNRGLNLRNCRQSSQYIKKKDKSNWRYPQHILFPKNVQLNEQWRISIKQRHFYIFILFLAESTTVSLKTLFLLCTSLDQSSVKLLTKHIINAMFMRSTHCSMLRDSWSSGSCLLQA